MSMRQQVWEGLFDSLTTCSRLRQYVVPVVGGDCGIAYAGTSADLYLQVTHPASQVPWSTGSRPPHTGRDLSHHPQPWWPSRESEWRMRNTARTSHREETWPKPRGTPQMRSHRWAPGYWPSSSSWSVDPQSSRSSRASGWACKKNLPADGFCSPVKYNMNSLTFFFFSVDRDKKSETTDFT